MASHPHSTDTTFFRLPRLARSRARSWVSWCAAGLLVLPVLAQEGNLEPKSADPELAKFEMAKAPAPKGLVLKANDRLAIVGDSITEQKMYSRIMETYLTVCVPDLQVTVRQFGWSGETAEGFLHRMKNDCLRFRPTVATTCYGMNDHRYKPYEESTAQWYRQNQTAIVRAFKEAGTRLVLGSPGCVGKMPGWVKSAAGTVDDLNISLGKFRNIDIEIAKAEGVGFADVFWPMVSSGVEARKRFGPEFAVAGKDGVHPDWAGQLIMAYAFLKGLGLDGDLGTVTVDLAGGKAAATGGHKVEGLKDGEVSLTSTRYPFCAGGDPDKDNSMRAGMVLVPFNQDLNRFTLVVKGAPAGGAKVTWGKTTRTYEAAKLAAGINLAEDFAENPFSGAFAKVDEAVNAKQAYETRQIKTLFHGDEGKADMEGTAAVTEKARAPYAAAIHQAFVPVQHKIRIEPN